jgi:hypothetical protein
VWHLACLLAAQLLKYSWLPRRCLLQVDEGSGDTSLLPVVLFSMALERLGLTECFGRCWVPYCSLATSHSGTIWNAPIWYYLSGCAFKAKLPHSVVMLCQWLCRSFLC